MPFKSQAQRRKFAQLLVEGKISNQTFEEWNRETGRCQTTRPRRSEEEGCEKGPGGSSIKSDEETVTITGDALRRQPGRGGAQREGFGAGGGNRA
jgi:hypothetical protein